LAAELTAKSETAEEMATKPEETIQMTHEEAKAWLTARNLFPRVTPVAEPGRWHLRKEDEGFLEFVHRQTGEVIVWEVPTAS
jgi:hypothetical protein